MQDPKTMTQAMIMSEIATTRTSLDNMAEFADRGKRGTFKDVEAERYRIATERLADLLDHAGASGRLKDEQNYANSGTKHRKFRR